MSAYCGLLCNVIRESIYFRRARENVLKMCVRVLVQTTSRRIHQARFPLVCISFVTSNAITMPLLEAKFERTYEKLGKNDVQRECKRLFEPIFTWR